MNDDHSSDGALRVLLGVVLAVTIAGGTVDLILDRPATWRSLHVMVEVLLVTTAVAASIILWRG